MIEFKDPKNVLDQVLDYNSGGVSKHLGQIADSMDKWEGPVAEELGLSQANISAIKEAHPKDFNLQVWVSIVHVLLARIHFVILWPL